MLINQKYKIKRPLILAILGSVFICISQLITDSTITYLIAKITAFHATSILYSFWTAPPYHVYIKVYVFNVTNSEEFLENGEKLRFQQIGPYTFEEILLNLNSTFNDNGTMTFEPRRLVEFRREKSVGDVNEDTFISPNVPLLGITAALKDASMVTNLGVASLSSYYDSQPFINVSIQDYLFGYEDPLVTLANTFVPNWIDFSRFGLLDRVMALDNGSDVVVLNTERLDETENYYSRRFSVNQWNGSPGLSHWGYNEEDIHNSSCSKIEGAYMGTIFSPNLRPGSTVNLYRHAFCRHIPLTHRENVTSKDGFEGYLYTLSDNAYGTPEENPDNRCYCKDDDCLPSGLTDISPCYYGIPITISQPHFLDADPSILEHVDGLQPNKDDHNTYMLLSPHLGLFLEAKMRIQINLAVPETRYNNKIKPFNNLVIPLCWFELTVEEVPSNIKLCLFLLYRVLPIAKEVLVYLLAVIGACMMIGSAISFLFFSNAQKMLNVNYSQVPLKENKIGLEPTGIIIKK